MFHLCKITVIQRNLNREICKKFLKQPERMKICDVVQVNQEFLVTDPFALPEGMCASAWADIRSHILTIATGGSYGFGTSSNVTVATCTDPFQPVIFKIERLSEDKCRKRA